MNKKLIIKILICVVLFFTYLYTFDPKKEITITLGLYSDSSWDVPNANTYDVIDEIIERYEKKYPYVHIKYESGISKSDYSSWLASKITNGNQPDIFIIPREDFNLLSNIKALEKLNDFENKRSIFYETSYNAGINNGELYALPIESNPILMCVNMNILTKENITLSKNWTIEDFYEICQKVTKDTNGDGIIDQFGSCDYLWRYVVEGYGINLFNEDGSKCYFNTSQMKNALLMSSKINALNAGKNVTSEDFDKGNVAFMPMSLAQYRTYKPYPYHVAKYSSFNWRCLTMPTSSNNPMFRLDTSLMGLSSKSTHKKMALEFMKMLCVNNESQQLYFSKMQGVSPLRSVMNSNDTKSLLKDDNFGEDALSVETLHLIMKQTKPYPKFKKYNTIIERADYLISKSINNENIENDLPNIQQQIINEL